MNDKEKTQPNKRGGYAALVWLVISIVIAVLFYTRGSSGQVQKLSQSEFYNYLNSDRIVSANIETGPDSVLSVSGDYLLGEQPTGPDSAVKADKGEKSKYQVQILDKDELSRQLQKYSFVKTTVESGANSWKQLLMPVLMFVLFIMIAFFVIRQFRSANRSAMDFGKSRARMINPGDLKISFNDIAGADEAKEEMQEIVEFLRDPLKFQLVGGRIPKGCLLVGEPGTGNTLMAKAIASEAGVPFFSISGSDFMEMFVGVGASRVRDMFADARKNMPCLIFIDEIDAVGRSRFSGMGGGHDEREQTLNALLVEMDGLETQGNIIVIAATNRPDVLDPALLRPGRFDRQVVMDLPDIRGRRQILDVHIKSIKCEPNINLDRIAKVTPGFSGADLANMCNEAALLAARYGQPAVTQKDLEEARDKVSFGRERKSRKISDRERKLTAYHEAGHALVALNCAHTTPVHKVTIVPRGQAYLGATFTMPTEDVYTRSRLELLDEMAMAMGGRAAEEIVFGDITTGAAADIEQVTKIARMMVCAYGMVESIGPIRYGNFRNHPLSRIDAPLPDSLGEETAREIDLAIRNLIAEARSRAIDILNIKREDLEKFSLALLEKETLDIDEINILLGRAPNSDVVINDKSDVAGEAPNASGVEK